mgnify:FL=1
MHWPTIISDLKAAGLSQSQVAEKCGVAQATISDLARIEGRQPAYDLGAKLVALHAESCGPKQQQAAA